MKNKLILLLILWGTLNLYAEAADDAGTDGYAFFKIRYSARATALGNSYSALADEADAVFYNPAGLVNLRERTFQTGYLSYFDDYNGGSAVYAFPYSAKVNLAFFTQFLTSSSTPKTEIIYQNGQMGFQDKGSFAANNIIVGASASRYFNEVLSFGGTVKVLYENIDSYSASALAFDLGLLHQTTYKNLKVAASIQNIGVALSSYGDKKEDLPLTFHVGFNYHPDEKANINVDIDKAMSDNFVPSVGLEYQIHSLFIMRAGYRFNSEDYKLGGDYEGFSGLAAGFGTHYNKIGIDYAVSSYGDLGFLHYISLKYAF